MHIWSIIFAAGENDERKAAHAPNENTNAEIKKAMTAALWQREHAHYNLLLKYS